MSMAMKYAMQKRGRKGCDVHEMCKGGPCMAEGGDMDFGSAESGEAGGTYDGERSPDYGNDGTELDFGSAESGGDGGAYDGEHSPDYSDDEQHDTKSANGMGMLRGSGQTGDTDIVSRIMQAFSKGGMVANDTEPMADSESADFDVLPEEDDMEFSDTGANSGDEIGDAQEDHDRRDIISRIMKSRSKKDRMPRPA